MRFFTTNIQKQGECNHWRAFVLLLVVVSLTFGSLPFYMNCGYVDEMEMVENNEIEGEADEKENKEEVESDDYVYNLASNCYLASISVLLSSDSCFYGLDNHFVDIVTPPPELTS